MLAIGPDNPQKFFFPWGISTPSNIWFLVPTRVRLDSQTASPSVYSFLWRAHERDKQAHTDRQTTLLRSGRTKKKAVGDDTEAPKALRLRRRVLHGVHNRSEMEIPRPTVIRALLLRL